jgi:formylglycine-generating enzyme required for sulfatase activity
MTPLLHNPTERAPRPAEHAAGTADGSADTDFPDTWTSPYDGSLLRLIPGGPFIMGSTADQIEAAERMDRDGALFSLKGEWPQFHVDLPAFYLGVYVATNAQFVRFLNSAAPDPAHQALWLAALESLTPPTRVGEPWLVEEGYENHPVAHVSWLGAEAYCRWAGLRLPTEIEWEKGARGADGRIFPWGNTWDATRLRWHGGDRINNATTAPVDAYSAGRSPYGLFQMAGNVEEWCADFYRPTIYRRYARGDLRLPTSGYGRVVRGGACLRRHPLEFRCPMRRGNPAAYVNILYTGFRCALDAADVQRSANPPVQANFRSPLICTLPP